MKSIDGIYADSGKLLVQPRGVSFGQCDSRQIEFAKELL